MPDHPHHQCDPADPSGPLTKLRVSRLLLAWIDTSKPDVAAFSKTLLDLGECPRCLQQAVFGLLGIAAKLQADLPDSRMGLELAIEAVEAELGDEPGRPPA